jgi:hypothetical protein
MSPLKALGVGTTIYFTQQRVMTYFLMLIALFGIGMMIVYSQFESAIGIIGLKTSESVCI